MTVSNTSKISYHQEIKGEKENSQDQMILKVIQQIQPCTARMIQKVLPEPMESSSIARSLNNLWSGKIKTPCIEKYFEAKCQVTQRKAQYYKIIGDLNNEIQ